MLGGEWPAVKACSYLFCLMLVVLHLEYYTRVEGCTFQTGTED